MLCLKISGYFTGTVAVEPKNYVFLISKASRQHRVLPQLAKQGQPF
jgi:hypothetical protein